MESGFFEYSCEAWVEQEGMKKFHGVVYADTFTNAMYELEHYYGNIENITLQGLEPSNVYDFEEGTVGFSLTVDKNGDICD